jgi:hypothetical protein
MSFHQPSNWSTVATIEDDSEHQLRLSFDEARRSIVVSCPCLDGKPLANLVVPNARVGEVYKRHLIEVALGK